jgi:hypothetical protein
MSLLSHVILARDHSKTFVIAGFQLEGIFLPSDASSAIYARESNPKCFIAIIITKRTI